jgi:hypothetical protein
MVRRGACPHYSIFPSATVHVKDISGCRSVTDKDASLYYIKNQQDATLVVLFISNCKTGWLVVSTDQ